MSRPFLDRQFFQAISASPELMAKHGAKGPWGEDLVPLYEWNDILYVGAADGYIERAWDFKVVVVFAPAPELKLFWQGLRASGPAPRIPGAAPVLEIAPEPILQEAPETPQSIFETDLPPLIQLSDESELVAEEPAVDELSLEDMGPANLNLNTAPAISLAHPSAPVQTPAKKVGNVSRSSSPAPSAYLEKVFQQVQAHYKKCMLMRVEGSQLVPWAWDSHFQGPTEGSAFNLEGASPFRIVQRTLKPYHGYVVPGEVQEKFFDEWNQSQIPDFLTLAPLVVNEQLVGILLCIGDKDLNQKASLTLSEKLGEEISNVISDQPHLLAS